jgi:hemolysin III
MILLSQARGAVGLDARRAVPREFAADRWIHVLGMSLGIIGAATLLARMATGADRGEAMAIVAYVVGLLSMLGCSAAYNFTPRSRARPLLRRFDQAAIFLMIAGTYTPFTTRSLAGGWAVALTGFIWIAALLGVAASLSLPRGLERLSIGTYLLLGWIMLAAYGPLTAGLDPLTIDLLAAGGVLYTVGVGIHVWRALPYHNAIWHGLIVVAACCHYAAILHAGLA